MSISALVPILPRETRHATLEAIYVSQGQWVARDECLFDIETDKVVLEIMAEQSGIIDEILVNIGDAVEAEQLILTLRAPTEQELQDMPAAKADAEEKARPQPAPQIIHDIQCRPEVVEINVPILPESVQDATICQLNVVKGQWVEQDDVVFEVETDKVILEVIAPYSGVIYDIKIDQGEAVVAQQLVMTMKERLSDAPNPMPADSPEPKPSRPTSDEPPQGSPNVFYGLMIFVVLLILAGMFFT
ncbi:MAG: hypothetical protein HRT35_00175 [Algicola sp.]|nr:hypothetical protein [Algicola sp.]